jgi:hypothetical protein
MKRPVSQLAKELRKLRIDFDINRPQMAKELKVTDKELENIELGRAEVSDAFLTAVSLKYSRDRDASNDVLSKLKSAYVDSISTITFDMSQMNPQQRLRVLALRATLAEENSIALAQAEEEKRKERERRAAERQSKKKAVVTEVAVDMTPAETKVVDDLDDLEDLSDDELDLLTEAA